MLPQENMQQQHNMFSTSVEKEPGYAMVELFHACSTKHARDQEPMPSIVLCSCVRYVIKRMADGKSTSNTISTCFWTFMDLYGRYVVLMNKPQSDHILHRYASYV